MNVYIVMYCEDKYEPSFIHKVFDSEEKANKCIADTRLISEDDDDYVDADNLYIETVIVE